MLKLQQGLFVLLLPLWTLATSTNKNGCVDSYHDFEEQTFGNNSENRLKLYEAFYPPNDHLPYSVVVTYQAVLPNGTRVNISTDPSCPDGQLWLWLSSPISLFDDPTEMNRIALYTLNYFTEWVPPHLIIATPLPCSAKAEGFLTLMTSSLQAYAVGDLLKGKQLGYSRQGCGTDMSNSSLKDVSSAIRIFRIVGITGFLVLSMFLCVVSVVLLQVLLKILSQKMETQSCSFEYYGIFWGLSAILCLVLMMLLYIDIADLLLFFRTDIHQTKYYKYAWPVAFSLPVVLCTPMAIYFGVKFRLTTPSVYILPAKLLCCCSEKHARMLVTSLTLWFDLAASFFLVAHSVYIVYAFPVAPFVVAVNVMQLVLIFTCLTYIMALVFTVCASVASGKCLRSNADCCATVRTAVLIPLLLSIICFSFTATLSGQFVNTATQQNSFYVILKSLFAPVLLAALGLGLKRFISVWMHWSPDNVEGGNAVNPLHGHVYHGYQAIDHVVVGYLH